MFWVALAKPFMAFVVLIPAWFIKRWIERNMRDGAFKTFLIKRRGDEMQAWFERQDERMFSSAKRVAGFITGRRR